MKKVLMIAGMAVMLSVASCKDKKEEPVTPPPPPPVENPSADPAPQPITQEEKDGTSINVSSDGVQVESKNGENKTDVNLSKDNQNIEIKTD